MHAVNFDALLESLDRTTLMDACPGILLALGDKARSLGFNTIADDIDYIEKRSAPAFRYIEKPSANPTSTPKGSYH